LITATNVRFDVALSRFLDDLGDFRVNDERDFGDVDVLLEVEQAHFQLGDLFLHRRGHLVAFAIGLAGFADVRSEIKTKSFFNQ